MFRVITSAPSTAPPAAVTASATRAPVANVTKPGRLTRPTTLMTKELGADTELDDTGCTGGRFALTGAGGWRITVKTVTSTANTPIAPKATTPARPGSVRTDSSQPRVPPAVSESGSQRKADSGSEPAAALARSSSSSSSSNSRPAGARRRCNSSGSMS
ncbi:Uncharacterised protein [Mycobacteroides abscessus]|nr:Uncharacterised protein [Mycobacteroides abscessus]